MTLGRMGTHCVQRLSSQTGPAGATGRWTRRKGSRWGGGHWGRGCRPATWGFGPRAPPAPASPSSCARAAGTFQQGQWGPLHPSWLSPWMGVFAGHSPLNDLGRGPWLSAGGNRHGHLQLEMVRGVMLGVDTASGSDPLRADPSQAVALKDGPPVFTAVTCPGPCLWPQSLDACSQPVLLHLLALATLSASVYPLPPCLEVSQSPGWGQYRARPPDRVSLLPPFTHTPHRPESKFSGGKRRDQILIQFSPGSNCLEKLLMH